MKTTTALLFLILATSLEVAGDALVRKAIYDYAGPARMALFLCGALLLFGYGFALNLAPMEFGQVVGLYIATLFVMWQIGNGIAFGKMPTTPILVGGALIVAGGLIVAFWRVPESV